MAYGKKAYSDFYDHRFRVHWTIELWQEDYSSSYTIMKLGETPVTIRKVSDGTLFDKVLQGTELTLTIQHEPGDDYDYLFTNNDRKFWVKLYRSGTMYWQGWVIPGQSTTGFNPYRQILIKCTDGLGSLRNVVYADEDSSGNQVAYTSFDTIINVVAKCLAYTGLTLNINSMVNILPTEYNSSPSLNVDPLYLVSVSQRRFMNSELDPTSVHTTLWQTLKPLIGCRLFMCYGEWWIIRTPEQFENNVKYRTFDSDGAYVSNSTLDMLNILTDRDGDPLVVPIVGASIERKLGGRSVEVVQDFGLRPSLFTAYNFPRKNFDPDTPTDPTLMKYFTPGPSSGWAVTKVGERYVMSGVTSTPAAGYFGTNPIIVRAGYAGGVGVPEDLKLVIKGVAVSSYLKSVPVNLIIKKSDNTYQYYYPTGATWVGTGASEPDEVHAFRMKFPAGEIDAPKDIEQLIEAPIPNDGELSIRIYNYTGNPVVHEIRLTILQNGNDWDWFINSNNYLIDEDNVSILPQQKMLFNDSMTSPYNVHLFSDGYYAMESLYSYIQFTTGWGMRDDSIEEPLDSWNAQMNIDNNQPTVFRGSIISELFNFYDTLKLPTYGDKIFIVDDAVIDIKKSQIIGTFIEIKETTTVFNLTRIAVNPIPPAAIETAQDDRTYVISGGSGGSTPVDFQDYRAESEAVNQGANTITFSGALTSNDYVISELRVIDAQGYAVGAVASSLLSTGFTLTAEQAGTLTYLAIMKL
jgi:hypothetical protein